MKDAKQIEFEIFLILYLFSTFPLTGLAQTDSPIPGPVSGHPVTVEGIDTIDVLARVELLRGELDLIRFEIGKRGDTRLKIAVSNVSPREVIFQAETLYRKVSILHVELTRARQPGLQLLLPVDIRPYHVWVFVNGAYERLLDLKKRIGITNSLDEKLQDVTVTSSEVFRSIVQANRLLDQLTEYRPSTMDVFHRVNLATYHAAGLLEQFQNATLMPDEPVLERGKHPEEVYQRLYNCYEQVHAIAGLSGIQMLRLELSQVKTTVDAVPLELTDVYDLITLIISELEYFRTKLKTGGPPIVPLDPGLKLPSHVYQRAGVLLQQLTELNAQVKINPGWLAR